MKKFAFAIVALSFSLGASATALPQGERTIVETGDCSLLSEGVALTLSTNVAGAYHCNPTNNTIAITACHPNGRKDSTGVNNFFYTASSAGGSIADAQDAVCDTAGTAAFTKAQAAAGVVQTQPADPVNP